MYEGKKIRLREYRKSDAEVAQNYINDKELKKNLNPGIPYPYTLQDEEKWFESNTALKDTYSFAIETLGDNVYIGGCGINQVDWKNSNVEIGIFIGNKEYWNKGYGTDAMNVLIRFIFNEMNINKIKLNVYSFNKRALKCYEKCGFKTEGVLRKELYREGNYHDIIVMGLLKEEFVR
ncbi:GNAT family N-acetyltransferase [Vallitalea guaymasensis]|uniref:GNAT family N-acetyltransferase n=1 Tax=Vallitalea guaymasensis TaxID=1185412 RepID=UPI00272D29E9|nr:GNAT family protein [Vallitalea guaymasensis]